MRISTRRKADEVQFMLTSVRQTTEEFHALRNLNRIIGRTKSEIIRHALAVAFPDLGFQTFDEQDRQTSIRRKYTLRSRSNKRQGK